MRSTDTKINFKHSDYLISYFFGREGRGEKRGWVNGT